MKILLIEDNIDKRNQIEKIIIEQLKSTATQFELTYAENLQEARRQILTSQFDLVIFDMYLPESSISTTTRDCSEELITEFSKSKNYKSEAIALTQFEINEVSNIQSFNLAGITVVQFSDSKKWMESLFHKLIRASQNVKYDFLVFCALPKERNAFRDTLCKIGDIRKISGMDCLEAEIDCKHGLIIKPHGMGLVNMAIVVSKAIELFQPKIVAMSGICAGVEGEANFLDIIVGKTCWEYQTGKWKDGEFKQEPYPVELERDLKIDLDHSVENKELLKTITTGLFFNELASFEVRVAPISSGSAVIADANMMEKIGTQHRKMAGLEMEMYSLYEAAAQSLCKPLFFGAKGVVDMGSASKGDFYHEPACIMTARYVSLIIQQKLNELI